MHLKESKTVTRRDLEMGMWCNCVVILKRYFTLKKNFFKLLFLSLFAVCVHEMRHDHECLVMFVRSSKDNFQVLITLLFHQVGLGSDFDLRLDSRPLLPPSLSLYHPPLPFCYIWGINLSNRKLTQTRQR